MSGPVFVTGAGRSGKTLLRWMISSHPNIVVTRRVEMWPRFAGRFGDLADPERLDECLRVILRRRQVAWLGPDRDRLRHDLATGPVTYERLFALVHEQHAARLHRGHWGDQSELYEHCAAALLRAYPGATVFHLVRDPRDRHEALLHRRGRRAGDAGRTTAAWLRSVGRATRFAGQFPDSYVIVRYEDLVCDPTGTAERVCTTLAEPFSRDMVRMAATHRYAPLDGCESPLSAEYVGRYRTQLPAHDVSFIESVAGGRMEALGYQDLGSTLSPRDRLRFAARWPVNQVGLRWRVGASATATVGTP